MIGQRDGGDGMKTTKAHLMKMLIEWQSPGFKNGNGFIFKQD